MTDDTLLKDFRTEYAKSGAAKCRVCEEKIAKVHSFNLSLNIFWQGEVRVCKKDYDDDRAKQYGPLDRWHHVACFAKNRSVAVLTLMLIVCQGVDDVLHFCRKPCRSQHTWKG